MFPNQSQSGIYLGSIQPMYLRYFLLDIWQEIQKTGGDENSSREAGTETDERLPPGPGDGVSIVAELGEQFEWKHSTEQGDDSHG